MTVKITEVSNFMKYVDELEAENRQLRRDVHDMQSAPTAYFVRCGCGRMRATGWCCPTIAEGGDCETGQ